MLFIQNGTIIDPVYGDMLEADILIENDRITMIRDRRRKDRYIVPPQAEILDATGCLVGPGLVDTHVHFRDPGFTYKEDIISGGKAAVKGGFTSIVLMANTKPAVDNLDTLSYVLGKGEETGIRIYSCANVTYGLQGKELTDFEKLYEAGAVGFTDDGIPLLNEDIVRRAMECCKKLGCPISFHEEDPSVITNNGINQGLASEYYGIGGSPREAEIRLIERDLKLAEETGATMVVQHISTKEGVELVRNAKKNGIHVYAEVTPHHFTLTEEAVIEKGTYAKMNPPLRTKEDRDAIIKGIQDGTIDLIATDHAPHSKEEKEKKITEAPSGIIGLETSLPLAIRELVMKGVITYPELFKRMSTTPCKLYGIEGGTVQEEGLADLVIFCPEEAFEVKDFCSKSANSPFVGEILPGVIKATICKGKVVYRA